MGDFDACRFDFRLDAKNGLMPSKRKKTERIQPSNYSTLFKCKLCGTLFSCRTSLLEHKLTHSEYRSNRSKYECSVCSGDKTMKFSRKDQLREHLSREHQLEDAQMAPLVGGRKPAAGARRIRGSNPRKGIELSLRKSADKRTFLGDDQKLCSDGGLAAAQVSNPSLPRIEPNQPQVPSSDHPSSSSSSYLYINFPILITPNSISGSCERDDRLLPAGIPWPANTTVVPQLNTEAEKTMNSQCGVMTSPNEFATYDLRCVQGSGWMVGRTVDASGNSVTDRDYPSLIGFSESAAIKRELSGSLALHDLAKRQGKNDDQGVTPLDFSVKSRLAPFELRESSFSTSASQRHPGIDSDIEVSDVVDLSWKGESPSSRSPVPVGQGSTGSIEMEKHGDNELSEELETLMSCGSGNSSTKTVVRGFNAAGIAVGISAGLMSEKRTNQRKPCSEPVSTSAPGSKTLRTIAVHSSMPQTSFRRGKSGLNKMVEKLWKNKIDQMSHGKWNSDRMSSGCEAQSRWMEDSGVEASESVVKQNEDRGESDEPSWSDDRGESDKPSWSDDRGESDKPSWSAEHLKFFGDPWIGTFSIELNGSPMSQGYQDRKETQSLKIASTKENNVVRSPHRDDFSGAILKKEEQDEEEDFAMENEVIDLTTSSITRRSGTPQQVDFVAESLKWNHLEDRDSCSKIPSPGTLASVSPSYIYSPLEEATTSFPDDRREDLGPVSSPDTSNPARPQVLEQLFPVPGRRYQDYLLERLLTDRQSRTGYESPASDPGCGSAVDLSQFGSQDALTSDAMGFEPELYCPTTVSGSTTPTMDRLSCSYPDCGKAFKEWRHLKVHLTLHTGEKPLSCYLCRYTCRHRSSMNWHMKSKHRLEKTKTSGNRTVYVDTTGSGAILQNTADPEESLKTEGNFEKAPSLLVEKEASMLCPERDVFYADQGKAFLIEPENEVFLMERKHETLLRELRLSLSLLKNSPGPEARQSPEVLTLPGSEADVAIVQRSTCEDEKSPSVTDQCLSRMRGLDASGCSTSFKDRFEGASGPQLLLKKVIPAPGKDPQFYTSLMRMKYSKHPSKLRRPRQPVKRIAAPVNSDNDVVAVQRCVTCNRIFESADALWLHGLSEHTEALHVCRCESCGFEAENRSELQSHVLSTHGKEIGDFKDYLCCVCGRGYSTRTGLNHHLLRHQEDSEVTHQDLSCPVVGCGTRLASRASLKHHLRCTHLGTTITLSDGECGPCPVEGEVSPLSLGVPSLATLGQTDERPVTCDYPGCDKSFRELKHLKVHQMQHTDEKPLRCHLCQYSCRQRNSMNWHMKSKHGQDKHVTSDGRTIYI